MQDYSLPSLVVLVKRVESQVATNSSKHLWTKRMALLENLGVYYWYAVTCVERIETAHNEMLGAVTENTSSDRSDRDYASSAIAFYGFAKVVIEATRLLKEDTIYSLVDNKTRYDLINLGQGYRSWANDVVSARNDITAHPHNFRKFITGNPSALGSSLHITFRSANIEELNFKEAFDLTPVNDLEKSWF